MKGFDTGADTSRYASRMAGLGYRFVARYLAPEGDWRHVSDDERAAIARAGLAVVSLSELGSGQQFDPERGRRQAELAALQAVRLGQPEGSAIFFCIDSDLPSVSSVIAHFEAIPENYPYAVGAYGPGKHLAALIEAGLVEYTILANATGWAGYQAFKDRADLVQGLTFRPFAPDPFRVDPLESAGDDFGQWSPPWA